ncbi:hypothetical protein PHYBLDRAFT_141882 [Phycomyces blakesleeanus NRRL 1555(-)]|uniref:Myb/SANT-like domain-containing protein n=1 Tax=Phycomyces blakesleeanus (strain ATCC 8743b / DSM 1359 / FGSC 10004 / NBRC 33097 / NRRL 1555) TaxID=763407 RepID=A0A162UU37_PHYB8|nr:hypothetical protein PHYBLDRAFT_141882 [Phycomyces blakesleeanus NRRL 1555(-)]OAD78022.1 hypothetical protein PHYBLDRAFT_141882 [Phycomyces blakesleeanus NRRL 1555(-)]|eukprot:XP_018296062.1 hypothetical protein PHYBLDRAFT_141882 [Phycomyces blakesleeanus NRRL 1555(-)]
MSMVVTNAKLVDPIHKWTTDDSKGKSKEALYSSVRVSFLEYGIATRNNNDIRAKIQNFRDKFQDTYKFLHNTGEGIKETTFSDDAMHSRPSAIPPAEMISESNTDVETILLSYAPSGVGALKEVTPQEEEETSRLLMEEFKPERKSRISIAFSSATQNPKKKKKSPVHH